MRSEPGESGDSELAGGGGEDGGEVERGFDWVFNEEETHHRQWRERGARESEKLRIRLFITLLT